MKQKRILYASFDDVSRETKAEKILKPLGAVAFWVLVWWLAAVRADSNLILPSPLTVVRTLFTLLGTSRFYLCTLTSFANVLSGILLAVLSSVLLSFLSNRFSFIRALVLPLMTVVKATPVASFILLAMVWIGSPRVPSLITFLIVLPVLWTNLDVGFSSIDKSLSEVSFVYGFSFWRRLRVLVLPTLRPYFVSALRTSLGLAWKAGIAAEVISMPPSSIGTSLGTAKNYLDTEEMFAWTFTVILISLLIELVVNRLLKRWK